MLDKKIQLDFGLIRPLLAGGKEPVQIKHLSVFEHVIDSTAKLMGKDGKSLSFAMLACNFLYIFTACFIIFKKELSCLGKGPAQVGITDLFADGSILLPVGLFGTFDQATVGSEVLHLGKTVDILYLVEQVQGDNFSYSRDCFE